VGCVNLSVREFAIIRPYNVQPRLPGAGRVVASARSRGNAAWARRRRDIVAAGSLAFGTFFPRPAIAIRSPSSASHRRDLRTDSQPDLRRSRRRSSFASPAKPEKAKTSAVA
jgi:hypothetical protein